MKKLILSLVAALVMSTGLLTVTSSTTSAAPRCPYTGCVKTVVDAKAVDSRKPGKIRAQFRVRTVGNAVPRGTVRVIVKGSDGTFRAVNIRYPGRASVSFLGLPSGTYEVTIKFIPGPNTAFARSSSSTVVEVK